MSLVPWVVPGDAFIARRLREAVGPDETVAARCGDVTVLATSRGISRVLVGAPDESGAREDAALDDLAGIVARSLRQWEPLVEALPIDVTGSELQVATWSAVRNLPSDALVTCAELSRLVGSRAAEVRRALEANPVPGLVPCHRVEAAVPLRGETVTA